MFISNHSCLSHTTLDKGQEMDELTKNSQNETLLKHPIITPTVKCTGHVLKCSIPMQTLHNNPSSATRWQQNPYNQSSVSITNEASVAGEHLIFSFKVRKVSNCQTEKSISQSALGGAPVETTTWWPLSTDVCLWSQIHFDPLNPVLPLIPVRNPNW